MIRSVTVAILLLLPGTEAAAQSHTITVERWLQSSAVRLRTVEPESGLSDMQPLKEVVGNARIVALGEPTHGNREIFRLKHRMLEFLVRELGFNVFALEAPLPEAFDINEYVLRGTGDPAKALAGITMWTWDTEEVLEMIEWMRGYNADPRNTRKLKFYGFDMQTPERAARVTLEYLDRVAPVLAETGRERLGRLAIPFTDPDSYGWRPVVESEADSAAARTIRAVVRSFDDREYDYVGASSREEWDFARQHAQVLARWIEANGDGGRAYGAVRDMAMAENVRWILDREGEAAKIALWGHNVHVSNTAAAHRPDSSSWAGRHLRRMFGDDLVIVGTLFDRGGFRAVEATPSGVLRSFSVGPAPEGTVEALLASAGLEVAALDLRELPPTGPVAEWFERPRPTRNSWGGYDEGAPEDYFLDYVLPEAFDVLLFVDSTTAVRTLNPTDYEPLPLLSTPGNLDFEDGPAGDTPDNWIAWSKLRRLGFEVLASAERPYSGSRTAMIRRTPGQRHGEASGSVLQRIDATPYRGKRIRLRAAARAEVPEDEDVVFLRLQIQPAPSADGHDPPDAIFDSLDEYRVNSSDWRVYEIVADVPEDAGVISYGLFLAGTGTAWFDDVAVDVSGERSAEHDGGPISDTLRYVEVINGRVLGSWSTWREGPDTWGYASERYIRFPRTDRLTLDAAGLPVHLETTSEIGDGVPWFESFERDGDIARWSTPRERGEVAVEDPAFYAAVYPAHDVGVLARALLRRPSRALSLLPEGSAHLESLGERVLRHDGRSRTVQLYAVHGLDLFPLYIWLDEDGTTFADEWTIREGWEDAFPELRAAMDTALAAHRRALARKLIPPERTRPLVIRGARLFDPATKTVREDMTIVVKGDRITSVAAGAGVEVPAGAETLDADGRMVLPGLWDMHAHHVVPADQEPLWSRGFAPLHLAGGVTTARDLGSHVESIVSLRDAIENGEAVGARILPAGYMNGPAGSGLMGVRVESAAEARAAVDRFAELGFVQIKTYNELPADLVHVVIERAKERGLRVGGHVPFAMTAREAIEAGYDELHHAQMTLSAVLLPTEEIIARGERWDTWYQVLAELTPDSEPIRELIGQLADSDVALDATLGHFTMEESPPEFIAHAVDRFPVTVSRRLKHTVFSDQYVPISPLARPAWRRAVANMFGLVRAAHEADVPIVVGTDTWAGFGLHHEMELLVRSGIPAPEVLALTTLGAARTMGMAAELGSIEPGKLADLILVDGDPARDIRHIRRVVTVVKDGRIYDPAEIYRALGIEPCCGR